MVHNFGINDLTVSARGDFIYGFWSRMIERCYSIKSLARYPTYKNFMVVEEWKYKSSFTRWAEPHAVKGWCLDKDLFGNSYSYSPTSCCFIPQEINKIFMDRTNGSNTMLGVFYKLPSKRMINERRKPWVSENNILGSKNKVTKHFSTEKEAHDNWKKNRAISIKQVSIQFKPLLTERVYRRLLDIAEALYYESNVVANMRVFCNENI